MIRALSYAADLALAIIVVAILVAASLLEAP